MREFTTGERLINLRKAYKEREEDLELCRLLLRREKARAEKWKARAWDMREQRDALREGKQ